MNNEVPAPALERLAQFVDPIILDEVHSDYEKQRLARRAELDAKLDAMEKRYSVDEPLSAEHFKSTRDWLFGDYSKYVIIDRVGMSVQKVPKLRWWRFWRFRLFGRRKDSGLVRYWKEKS